MALRHGAGWILGGCAALAAACGARSQLGETRGAATGGGDGGATSSSASSGGAGGAGGGGGPAVACFVDGPPVGLDGTEGYSVSQPSLVLSSDDAASATIAATWTAVEGPQIENELRHASFAPWGRWPADHTIGPSFIADYDGGEQFAAARADGGFSLFFQSQQSPPPGPPGLWFLRDLVPGSGALPEVALVHDDLGHVHFAAEAAELAGGPHLLGYSVGGAAPDVLQVALVKKVPEGLYVQGPILVGCAMDAVSAAAAPVPGGWILAASAGSALADPACESGGEIGFADRLLIALAESDGTITLGADIGGGGSIAAVAAAPFAEGAWVASTRYSGGGPAPLSLARVALDGPAVLEEFPVPFDGDPISIAAAGLGQYLALGWLGPAPGSTSARVSVAIHDSGGALVTTAAIDLPEQPAGALSMIASPSGDALLLAWTQGAFPEQEVRVARVVCELP